MLVQEARHYNLDCQPVLDFTRVLGISSKIPDIDASIFEENNLDVGLPATKLFALSEDNSFAHAIACPAKKDQPIYDKPVQQIRDTLQAERAREDPSLGKDRVAEQQVHQAFRSDSAMVDVDKPVREHIAKMASILQTGAPILNQLKISTSVPTQLLIEELPSTPAAALQTPQAEFRPLQARNIKIVETGRLEKDTVPAIPRVASGQRQAPDEVGVCLKAPAAPVKSAAWEQTSPTSPATPPQAAEPRPASIKPDCKCH